MSNNNLTDKQERFVEEYMIDCNATQAAIRAGYSKNNADKIGSELLGKTRVADAVSKAKAKLRNKSGKSADWVIKRLIKEAKTAKNDGARVSALDKLGKHFGIYEEDNSQKSIMPVNVEVKSVPVKKTDDDTA